MEKTELSSISETKKEKKYSKKNLDHWFTLSK